MNPSVLLDPFRDLYRRRLWPVAVVLAGAAVAAPIVLGAPDEAPVPAAVAPGASSEGLDAASIVSVAAPDGTRRRVLGAAKDPFKPSGRQPKPLKAVIVQAPSPATASAAATVTGGGASTPFGGGGGASAPASSAPSLPTPTFNGPLSPAPVAPVGDAPAAAPVHSLTVSFDGGAKQTLRRLDALPGADDPVAIYLGVLEHSRTAVFLIDAGVVAEGDGRCNPTPDDCQRLYLKQGETEFFDVPAADGGEPAQHQLDLVHVATRAGGKAARSASAHATTVGRRALRARFSRVGRLRYDARTDVLRKISVAAHRAELARARAAHR